MADIAQMSSRELSTYIEQLEQKHRRRMKALRALARAREEEEIAESQGTSTT